MPAAPDFWWAETPGLVARLLQPVGLLYGAIAGRRMMRPGKSLPVPIVCVGNLVVGGAGKTPTALALAAILRDAGHRPAFLSRGYGRDITRRTADATLRVDPERHIATEVGDEPLLLARLAPTYVSRDRFAAGRQAIGDGASVLILDDGLQNPALAKSVALAVVDGTVGVGNGLCMPAGPMRAPLSAQWPRVTAVCIVGNGRSGERVAEAAEAQGRPVLRAGLEPDSTVVNALRGRPLYALTGIGQPQKFFSTLDALGLTVRGRRAFPDHHRFAPAELTELERDAAAQGAVLVTTAKDHTRLPEAFPALVLPVTLRFTDLAAVAEVLRPVLDNTDHDSPSGSS